MEEKEFDYMNVIPFIDIMLVLLAIVLTTSTLVAQGIIPIQLPQASQGKNQTLKTLSIEVDKRGVIFFNGNSLSMNNLLGQLKQFNRKSPVLIRADRSIALQVFVNVLDAIKQTGFTQISLQTESKK